MLITHNLKAAWRNILKYKVQNTISVLCLSVGVILFAITLYLTNVLWESRFKQPFQSDRVYCEIYKENENGNKVYYHIGGIFDGFNEIKRINQLPSVEKTIYISDQYSTKFMLYDNQGNSKKSSEMSYRIVSPEWLAENNFRSSITDRKIGTLKPGTIVVKQFWRNKDDLNWAGATVSCFGKKQKISDVVYSPTYDEDDRFFIVADTTANYELFAASSFNCVVKKGYTKEQVIRDLKKLYPDYKIKWDPDYKKEKNIMIIVLFCLILLGSSVLIIGVSGFLKMQLQLFLLRSREMALRRCNGAKPFQLFILLCYELLIVFCFVAVISILLSIAFADHALPLVQRSGMMGGFCIYPHLIYETEPYIVIVTLLCAIGIAWLVVRRTLKSPLSQTVGRSFTQRTLWNGTMQVVQYLVTIILFSVIILSFVCMSEVSEKYKKNMDPDYFKNVLNIPLVLDSTWNEVKEIAQLPSVEKKAGICNAYASIQTKEDSIMNNDIIPHGSDTYNYYSWLVAEAEYFSMFKHEIKEKPDSGDVCRTTPVFASKEDVDNLKHLLSLNYNTGNEETLLPDGNKYIKIGYTDDDKTTKVDDRVGSGFYIIKDVDKYSPNGENVKAYVNIRQCWMYIIPKNNDQELFSKEYDALMHKYRHAPNDVHYPIATVYDLKFKTHQIVNLITEFLTILTAVSILCIILTVYSSISLETRGKQKEVAIRKVNGAKTRDIVMLFSRYYIITLCTAFALSLLIGVALVIVISITVNEWPGWTSETTRVLTICSLESMATITLVTLLTVWQKIYKISHINPALLIKKE